MFLCGVNERMFYFYIEWSRTEIMKDIINGVSTITGWQQQWW